MRRGDWREVIGHDGHLVVRLHLFDVSEGGQDRHLPSGYRADWTAAPDGGPMHGPITFPDPALRSVAPGTSAVVHVHPMQPAEWVDVGPGAELRMCRNWPRALGAAVVLERVDVPDGFVPLLLPPPPPGSVAAVLRYRPSWRERVAGWFRG